MSDFDKADGLNCNLSVFALGQQTCTQGMHRHVQESHVQSNVTLNVTQVCYLHFSFTKRLVYLLK